VGTYNSGSNGLYAVNPTSHNIEWSFQTDDGYNQGSPIDSSPGIAPDCSIVFLAAGGDLFAVNPDSSLKWFFPLPANSYPDGSPAMDKAGNIFVGSHDGYVYCINSSGGLLWIFDTTNNNSPIQASIAIGPDLTVYAASTDGSLYAITNGGLKWRFNATNTSGNPIAFISSPALSEDGVIYIGGEDYNNLSDNLVYAITNGAVKWTFPTGGYVIASPAISPATGGVIVASEDGKVYQLAGSNGQATNAIWPMFHANPGRIGATPNASCSGGASLVAFPNNPSMKLASGQFSFYISGTPGSGWAIYASSNLTTWESIGFVTVGPNSGYGSFTDTNITGLTNRFYQARTAAACSPVIGFINMTIPPGTNLIANPFYQINDNQYPQNTAKATVGRRTSPPVSLGFSW
jgi:outer membrane protein assembly factor BamB